MKIWSGAINTRVSHHQMSLKTQPVQQQAHEVRRLHQCQAIKKLATTEGLVYLHISQSSPQQPFHWSLWSSSQYWQKGLLRQEFHLEYSRKHSLSSQQALRFVSVQHDGSSQQYLYHHGLDECCFILIDDLKAYKSFASIVLLLYSNPTSAVQGYLKLLIRSLNSSLSTFMSQKNNIVELMVNKPAQKPNVLCAKAN